MDQSYIDEMLSPNFDVHAFVERQLTEQLLNTIIPRTGRTWRQELEREEAMILYGKRAFPQRHSDHREARRDKRRARKARGKPS